MYDPDRYRTSAEIDRWKERDPLLVLEERLRSSGGDEVEERLTAVSAEADAEVDDAVAFADAAELEPLEELTRWVHSDESSVPRQEAVRP
jgi:pyruvate dehydrogenase E1 component alpha subunit